MTIAHRAAAEATRGLRALPTELSEHLSQLLAAMRSIGTGLDLNTTLDDIARTAAELAGARYASIVVIDSTSGDLDHFASSFGIDEVDRTRIDEIPAGRDATLTVPIEVEGEIFGDLVLAEKIGGAAFTPADVSRVRIIATEAGIAIGNSRLYEAARGRERWIDGAAAVTTALLSNADDTDALQVVAEQARTLADAAAGLVLLRANGDDAMLVVAAAADGDLADIVGTAIPACSPIVPQLLSGKPLFMDDTATDPRMTTHLPTRYGPCMMLPLKSGTRVLGALAIPREPGAPLYTEAEKNLAARFASQAALALVLSEAQRDRERLVVFEDRDRIARDLHDFAIQRLFATGMQLQGAERLTEVPEVRRRIEQAVDDLDTTITEIRTAIYALQQEPEQAPAGLKALVLREVATAAAPLGFQPSTSFVGPVDTQLDDPTTHHLLAALREALSNARRHARATQIGVVVDATATLPDGRDAVRLTVADDGVGLPDDVEEGRRSGLSNLERRAAELGGSVSYGGGLGDRGGGTSVFWEVPLT